jgi:hypothetical protein
MTIDCEYFEDHQCKMAGQMIGEVSIPTNEGACNYCITTAKPARKAPNSVTAGLALRYLRQKPDYDKTRFDSVRKELHRLLECGSPGKCADVANVESIRLVCQLSPGDMLTITAAVYSLAMTYPGRWKVEVSGTSMELWENNPHISSLNCAEKEKTLDIQMAYPSVHRSNETHTPFLNGYCEFLGSVLGVSLPLATNRPHLYLSNDERSWISQIKELTNDDRPFALIDAGVKSDFTAKQWPVEYYQDVVNQTKDKIEWVQVGAKEHDHVPLDNVINLIGETSTRELIRLAYHCRFALGPVTFLQHLCAAWEKPYICLVGGREPVTWVTYPKQHTLHTIGQLDCCRDHACWKSKVVGGDSVCEHPSNNGWARPVAKCMSLIKPIEVVNIVNSICNGIAGNITCKV